MDRHEITLEDFKKVVPCKDEFFVQRIFKIFDKDRSGYITQGKFIETVAQFSVVDDDTKIEFLFNIYDINEDGNLDEDELTNLASALFQDGVKDGQDHMDLDDFNEQLIRHGLVDDLGLMINKWLVPPAPPRKKTFCERLQDKLPQRYMSKEYWSNNKSLHSAIFVILVINIILFVHRAYYFRNFSMLNGLTPNPFYLLSRACGRVLHFNTCLVLALVLRNTITILRRFGLATILPLDHNIYLHKLVGFLIFF